MQLIVTAGFGQPENAADQVRIAPLTLWIVRLS